jgi:hypothetical protein
MDNSGRNAGMLPLVRGMRHSMGLIANVKDQARL